MAYRKYLLILLFIAFACAGQAQNLNSFAQADSIANAQYNAGDWSQLIITGKRAIDGGFDSPALRQKLGYARLIRQDYSGALGEYSALFKNDSHNQTARFYAYLCHKYLNQDLGASYDAAQLDTNQQKSENISAFGLLNAGFESGVKVNDNSYRGTANYSRVYLANRLSWRLQMDQSVAYFNQYISGSTVHFRGSDLVATINSPDVQLEYYGKLSYSLTANLLLMGAYHYMHTSYQSVAIGNNIGVAAVRYNGVYWAIQADVNMGNLTEEHFNQYNVALMLYPMGNLNFYTVSRGSYHDQNSVRNAIFGQSVGYKLFKNTWAETSATFGNLDNYIDADGLYVYNAIDPTKLKLGETIFYQWGKHAQLQLTYTYEKKQDDIHSLNYNQNSITAGLLWKF